MESSKPLQVLVVEDSENDALLLEMELQRSGYEVSFHRVDTKEAMVTALNTQRWDLIIADYLMPRFNGLEALSLANARGLDVPFIIVSGHITDNTAVAAMKAGAHDYVMKDNLARLGPAVQRELREAEIRRERRRSEEKLKVEQVFRRAIENSVPSGITAVDLDGRQTYVNPSFCAMLGWNEEELIGARPPFAYWPPEHIDTITQALTEVVRSATPAGAIEARFRRRTEERLDVLLQITPLKDTYGNITGWVSSVSDITERKRAETRLAAEHGITWLLVTAQSLDEAAPGILQVLLDSLDVDVGTFWVADSEHGVLRASSALARSSVPGLQAFREANQQLIAPRADSLPGRVWTEQRAVWERDLSCEPSFQRRELAAAAGMNTAMAFPIQSAQQFLGVLEFFALRRSSPDERSLNMMTAIGSEIGQFIERRRAEEALRRAHDELETRVHQRTLELKTANQKLQAAIAERRRLENELLEITEKERRRFALDLHDDLGQKLSGIALMTKGLELKLSRGQSSEAEEAARIHTLVQEAMNHASDLAHDLATLDLAEKDLPAALSDLADHGRELFDVTCKFTQEGTMPALDNSVITQLYKIAQEAVTNAIKHGKAKRVAISLVGAPDKLLMSVQNNGMPFPDLGTRSTGMGLRIMNYRANLIGASLEIKPAGAKGTLVTCVLPYEKS
jgi:PAS domain S-box-containing protein